MAIVSEFHCPECGLDLVDETRAFIWDGESNETIDFLILMSTYQWLDGAKISGNVTETFCSDCDRYLKVYSITDVEDGIENPSRIVEEGIKNHIDALSRNLVELKQIEMRADYTLSEEEGSYLFEFVEYGYSCEYPRDMPKDAAIESALKGFHEDIGNLIDSRLEAYGRHVRSNYLVVEDSQDAACPVCGGNVDMHVDAMKGCPRCGSELDCGGTVFYD